MCVNICAEGLCNCRIPFYVFPPTGGTTKEEKIGFITKIWAGMTSEVFTDAAKFEVSMCEKRSLRVASLQNYSRKCGLCQRGGERERGCAARVLV